MQPRSRAQRAFYAWLKDAAPQFRIPLSITRRTDRQVEFLFSGITPLLHGFLRFGRVSEWHLLDRKRVRTKRLSHGELVISTDWQEDCWDVLVWNDAYPVRTSTGYTCYECLPEFQSVFPNRESLWRDHLFEPLFEWTNTQLADAEAVGLYQTKGGGIRWAKLLPAGQTDDPECLVEKIPLRGAA